MNRARGEIALPGTDYVLRYSINALCDVESEAGLNLPQVFAEMEGGKTPSFSILRALLWAGLRETSPKLTVRDAGNILGEVGAGEAGRVIGEALVAAIGTDEKTSEKKA